MLVRRIGYLSMVLLVGACGGGDSAEQVTLTIANSGNGTGLVTSAPAGIDCGATCEATFDAGTVVTLTGAPGSFSWWSGWNGGGCTGLGACEITLNADTEIQAPFFLLAYTVTIIKSGTGTGTVTSNPAGIACGATCEATFPHGAIVTFSGVPGAGSLRTTWTGPSGCAGTGDCILTIVSDTTISIPFNLVP